MDRVEVIHMAGSKEGGTTQGIARDKAFEMKDIVIGRSRVAGGVSSAWHHHGKREVYGFIVSGTLRFEYGKGESDFAVASTGDFFHIPVGLIHRDVNPNGGTEAVVVNIMSGRGPSVVNVDGPA